MSHALPNNNVALGTAPCVGGRNLDLSAYGVQQVKVKYSSNVTVPLASKGNWTIHQSALATNGSIVCNGPGPQVVNADSFNWTFYAGNYSVAPNGSSPTYGLPGQFIMFSAVQNCSSDPKAECPYFVSDNYTILNYDGSSVNPDLRSSARPAFSIASWATIALTAMAAVAGLGCTSL